jgi:hypothetical protein
MADGLPHYIPKYLMSADNIDWGFNFSLGEKTFYFRHSQVMWAVAMDYCFAVSSEGIECVKPCELSTYR